MNAALIEDSPEELTAECALIRNNRNCSFCDGFSCFAQLLEAVKTGKKYELVFMDIELSDGQNGIDVAEKLHTLMPNAQVIFITSYAKYSQDIFLKQINLAGFLLKPLDQEKLDILTDKALQRIKNASARKIVLTFRQKNFTLLTDEILYIESVGHMVFIHLIGGRTENGYEKLAEIGRLLPASFAQCHQSFLVNMGEIVSLEGNSAVLSNGEAIPVSRSRYAVFRDTYFKYLENLI